MRLDIDFDLEVLYLLRLLERGHTCLFHGFNVPFYMIVASNREYVIYSSSLGILVTIVHRT